MSKKIYPETNPRPDFPKIEEGVLAFWDRDGTFEKSVELRDRGHGNGTNSVLGGQAEGAGKASSGAYKSVREDASRTATDEGPDKTEFVFYDGPPFANGLPHYGHVLQSYTKDTVGRYKTMRGFKVARRWGWDCHGLPPELKTEKELGISGKKEIEAYGVDKFVEKCRADVQEYADEWKGIVRRLGRWVDMENAYKTMDMSYSESIMWAFKTLYDKGLVYEDFRILPYSWAAETPLSNFEVNQAYKEKTDPAITVKFRLKLDSKSAKKLVLGAAPDKISLLVWTTTPWTLPSNLMLAVGEDIEYSVFDLDDEKIVLASSRAEAYKRELINAKPAGTIKGSDLVGLGYEPLFPYFAHLGNGTGEHKAENVLGERLVGAARDGAQSVHEIREHGGQAGTTQASDKTFTGAFKVAVADFVSTEDGTGIVHIAPGFGEDDFALGRATGLPIVCPVDGTGCFTAEVSDWAGVNVFEANHAIIEYLRTGRHPKKPALGGQAEGANKANAGAYKSVREDVSRAATDEGPVKAGFLFKKDQITHQYPFCWRTDKPLIYKAMSSWFVRVTAIKDELVAANQRVDWIPEHIRDGRFGKWLEGARDWSISRNRFWGAPIPVWKSDSGKVKVMGSIAELEKLSGKKVSDLHRPYIDAITFEIDGETYRRTSDVFDCWFESGSMPFASVHYPFENKDAFERNFPADFIAEAVEMTRGWFYTLSVLGVALFGKIPFRNCVVTGLIFDDKKQKLSKKLGNYSEPTEFFNRYGSDSFRWLLLSSPVLKGEVAYISKEGEEVAKAARRSLVPFYNAYHFFTLYANADSIRASYSLDSPDLLDRYITAKLAELKAVAAKSMDAYDVAAFCHAAERFLDVLNNWYIRLSRERFWGTSVDRRTQKSAFDTLYSVLVDLCKLTAPVLPFTAEYIYKNLTGEESAHLENYPLPPDDYDRRLIEAMDLAGLVCSAAKAAREDAGIRNRQPLSSMTVASSKAETLSPYSDILKAECNVKSVDLVADIGRYAKSELYIYTPLVGKRLGSALRDIQNAARAGAYSIENGMCEIAGYELSPDEYEIKVRPAGGFAGRATSDNSAVVLLDTLVTPELEIEGAMRDFMRAVQEKRKAAGLDVSDRIRVEYFSDRERMIGGVGAFESEIRSTTLATSLDLALGKDGMNAVDGAGLWFRIEKV
ncbi:MAG: isoleucine--tRNA ligase [Rickettsiales bacterium]|nr:isoleucine--tRNA ligase [Rickettsiales bacterium]